MSAPAHTVLSVHQFLTKNDKTSVPHTPHSSDFTPSDSFFVSPDEKSPQREKFCQCGKSEKKIAEAPKGIKIKFKNF